MPAWMLVFLFAAVALMAVILGKRSRRKAVLFEEAQGVMLNVFPPTLLEKLEAGADVRIGPAEEIAGFTGRETIRCGRLDDHGFTLLKLKRGKRYGLILRGASDGWRVEGDYPADSEIGSIMSRIFSLIEEREKPKPAEAAPVT